MIRGLLFVSGLGIRRVWYLQILYSSQLAILRNSDISLLNVNVSKSN
jgi:hypothetical protein